MKIYSIIVLLIGVFVGLGAALPFFDNKGPYKRLGMTPPPTKRPSPPKPKAPRTGPKIKPVSPPLPKPRQMLDNRQFFDTDGMFAPANMGVPQEQAKVYVSSSASDYDSTPSDGGGDTNPTLPTLPPGGEPTPASNSQNIVELNTKNVGGITAGVIVGLAVVVGIAVAVAIYIIKKKG